MDKSKPSTITIKINGRNRSFKEEKAPVIEEEPSFQEVIQSQQESAASAEAEEESFDWILPTPEDEFSKKESIFVTPNKNNKGATITTIGWNKKNNSVGLIKSLLIAIVFAVTLGISFGWIVLNTITAKKEESVATSVPTPTQTETNPTESADIPLPSIQAFVVQGGVFSTLEAATVQQEAFKLKKLSTEIFQLDGKFYILLGAGNNLEGTKSISVYYKGLGVDAFWKEITIEAPKEMQANETDLDTITKSIQYFNSLTALYSLAMTGDRSVKVNGDANIQEHLQANVSKLEDESMQQAITELLTSQSKLSDFAKNGKIEELVQGQQHLLNFLKIYQKG
ncbi:hypothetical protein [Peribacillus acanthi]|uniref:hypothetical protein n=1 Tax=Peribacillus acanthi TaxID=2171554 RepID=UPI000D3E07A7|nr:hypothetical protein [Peribacillus acanthi]